MLNGGAMDAARELIVLRNEMESNAKLIARLRHELHTARVEHQANRRAVSGHLATLRQEMAALQEKVASRRRYAETTQRERVPRAAVDAAKKQLALRQRHLMDRRRELAVLEDILKEFISDERLALEEAFHAEDSNSSSYHPSEVKTRKLALKMILDNANTRDATAAV